MYQARYKCFPVGSDEYFYQVFGTWSATRRVPTWSATPIQWRWSSLWHRLHDTPQQRSVLSDWPMPLPRDWLAWLNRAETEAELEASA